MPAFLRPHSDALPTCGYVGNSDVYGLGIRVGIYLQWVSGILAKAFLDEEALRDVLNENVVFLLAIFLATVLLVTDTISGVHSVDILIMLHIFFGSIYTIFVDHRILERMEFFSSLIGIVFTWAVATGMASIGVWFWFWFYEIHPPSDPTCSEYAFLFRRVGLSSKGTIMAYKAFATINMIVCSTLMLGFIAARINLWVFLIAQSVLSPNNEDVKAELKRKAGRIREWRQWILSGSVPAERDYLKEVDEQERKLLKRFKALKDKLIQNERFSRFASVSLFVDEVLAIIVQQTTLSGLNTSQRLGIERFGRYLVLLPNIFVFIYSIICVKLLIGYNDITDVFPILSTGQIIPFIIGIASLWRVVWEIIRKHVKKELKAEEDKLRKQSPAGKENAPMRTSETLFHLNWSAVKMPSVNAEENTSPNIDPSSSLALRPTDV